MSIEDSAGCGTGVGTGIKNRVFGGEGGATERGVCIVTFASPPCVGANMYRDHHCASIGMRQIDCGCVAVWLTEKIRQKIKKN